jgi:AcrR family transcriptional regulator
MRAAERLFAEKGANNVTIREIVETAGQKNESALQYHFKNLEGLIAATHRYRDAQIVAVRSRCLDELADQSDQPQLRDIAIAMVHPTFELAGKHADFRRYIRGFSLSLATSDVSPMISGATWQQGERRTPWVICCELRYPSWIMNPTADA